MLQAGLELAKDKLRTTLNFSFVDRVSLCSFVWSETGWPWNSQRPSSYFLSSAGTTSL